MTSFALSDGTRSLELIGMPPGIYLAAEPFELPVAANEDTYATSPDMNGGRRVRSTPQNVEGRAAVHIDELTSADFWDSVDNFLDLVASAHRNKGTITWTPPEGVAVTFDLEAINPVSFPQNRLLRQRKGTVEFGFTARPYGLMASRSLTPAGDPYATVVLADAPALYWRLGSGGTTDQSGNGRNGTAGGGVTIGGHLPGALSGDADTATDFDGTDDHISCSYNPFVNGTTRTFEGWAWRDTSSAEDAIFAGSGGAGCALVLAPGSTNVLFYADTNAGAATWTGAWPGNGQWVHWAVVFNEATNTAELYINGASQGTQTQATAYAGSVPNLEVGAYVSGSFWQFDGKLDEFAVYEGGLTAAQILEHYEAGAGTSGGITFTGPIDSTDLEDVSGHVDAFAELTLTDSDGQVRDDVEIGVQPDHDPGDPWPLRIEAADLEELSGTLNVDVIEGSTVPQWVALAGTGEQPHHGLWRVKAWIETTAEDAQVRLSWKAGDGHPRELVPVLPHLSDQVIEVDLGLINIAEVSGTHAWTGQVEVRAATAGEDFNLHAIQFIPGNGWARARAPAASFVPTSIVVADSFDQAGDPNLTGQTPQIGSTWAVVTGSDADDITVDSTQHRAERAAVSDAFLYVGRMVSAGATNYASVQIQGEVDLQSDPVSASSLRQGYFCRLVDINNWLAIVRINSAAAKTFRVEVLKRDGGGSPVTLALSGTLGDLKDTYMLCLRVEVTGRWTAWAWPTGAAQPSTPLLSGSDADLATGGTLDDGRVGLFGANTSASAVTMVWDDVAVFPGPGVDHVIWDDESLRLDHEKAEHENEAGTRWGEVPYFEGARFAVPPATRNDLVSRLVVKQDRNDLAAFPVADAGDELQGELTVTERVLLTNGGA